MSSIRFTIISFLVASLLVINVISGYYIYQHTQQEVAEIFNAQQAQVARIIEQLISDSEISNDQVPLISEVPDVQASKETNTIGHAYEKKIAYQVWGLDGNILLMSANAPLQPLANQTEGFSQTQYEQDTWYVFTLYSKTSQKWIHTAQNAEARNELIAMITQDHLITMLIVNLLILLLVIGSVIHGTRPIVTLSKQIANRGANCLEPISTPISSELKPIQEGVNRLLDRINDKIKQEKSFSADLSHELRTPLAAIKIHAQNLELRETLSQEGHVSIELMSQSVDNMNKIIEQLLLLNNIETNEQNLLHETVALKPLAKEVLALLPPQIHKKNQLELSGENIEILGNRALLGVLIRNLIENASKYSDQDTQIIVHLSQFNQQPIIEVIDSGPGMTAEQKKNSIKRHYRISDSQTYGSGLGLSIVKKITDLHNAELNFIDRDNEKGLIAQIRFKN